MKKKKLIFFLIVIGIIVLIITLILTGVITFDTVGQNNQTVTEASSVDQLSNGCYYVWHNDKTDNIINDLADTTSGEIVFRLCPSGEVNWNDDEFVNHTIWFTNSFYQFWKRFNRIYRRIIVDCLYPATVFYRRNCFIRNYSRVLYIHFVQRISENTKTAGNSAVFERGSCYGIWNSGSNKNNYKLLKNLFWVLH